METISITINGTKIDTKKGITILEASQNAGIYIPSLCAHPDLPPLIGILFFHPKDMKDANFAL